MRSAALVAAFVLLTAGECTGDLFGPIDEPGRIDVTNNSDEQAVVEIGADDVKAYANLAPGASAWVNTIAGGHYYVRVIMSGSNTERYSGNLNDLTGYAEKLLAGTAAVPQQAAVFSWLKEMDAVIASLEQDVIATCDGTLKLNGETAESVAATITRGGAGESWQAVCESN